jgi:hypothetical protein
MTEVGNLVADRTGGGHGGGSTNAKKKKQSPQEAWMDLLQSSVDTAPVSIQSHLRNMVTTLDNIPRKEKQFRNFAMNSLNLGRGAQASKILDAIWNHLSEQREKQKIEREAAAAAAAAASSTTTTKDTREPTTAKDESEPKIAIPSESEDNNDTDGTTEAQDKSQQQRQSTTSTTKSSKSKSKSTYKTVKQTTKKILKKAPGKSMKYKKLQKQLREMIGCTKEEVSELLEKVIAKEGKKYTLDGKDIKIIV